MSDISTRTMCSILDDMRDCLKTHNFSYLPSLIGEAQYRANRMENRIEMISDIEYAEKRRISLKKEIKELQAKRDSLSDAED